MPEAHRYTKPDQFFHGTVKYNTVQPGNSTLNPPCRWEVEGNSTHGPLGVGDINGGHHRPITGEICPKVWPLRGCVSESLGRFCLEMKVAGFLSAVLLFQKAEAGQLAPLARKVGIVSQSPKVWNQLIQEMMESSPSLLFGSARVSPVSPEPLIQKLEQLLETGSLVQKAHQDIVDVAKSYQLYFAKTGDSPRFRQSPCLVSTPKEVCVE